VQIDDSSWLLDTKVCNYRGIGRFVMGLMDDIEIVDSPDFEGYIREQIELASKKI
jgi:hypothetical protein